MKKMTKAMLITALILGSVQWGGTPVHASKLDTFTLDEYVVTATRTPVELFNANANISVVTKEEIENRHYQNVKEALEDVPGVQIRDYGRAGYTTQNKIVINGSDKVLFMVDGVRMNQGAEPNLYELLNDMDNVERIEVLHGSASSLYGADAQGGVINVITKSTPENKTKLFIEGGDFSKTRMGISTQGTEKDWSYRLAFSKDKIGDAEAGNGEEIRQSNDSRNISMMVSRKLGDNGDKGNVSLAYDKFKSEYSYYDIPSYGGGLNEGTYELESYRLTFDYNFDDSLTNKLTLARNERLLHPSWGDTNIVSISVNEQLTKNIGDNNTLTGGIDYQEDKFNEGFDGSSWGAGYTNGNGQKIRNTGFYLQDYHEFTDKINITLGARYDNNDRFDSEFTGNGKVGYKFNDDTNVYVSYGTFFNTPTTYALFNSEYGDSSLNPESGETVEFGLNHKFDDTFTMRTHIFKRETKDKVVFNYAINKYDNLEDEEDAKGFDIQFKKKLSDKWDTSIAYTYTKTESGNGGQKVVNNFGYIPKHMVDISLGYNLKKFNANLTANGIFDKPGYETTNGKNFPCDNYWIIDLGLNYKPDINHKFYFKVNNLFDKFYANESNVKYGLPGEYYAMPGRAFFVGAEYSF
ncbi:MAG: TonB-dependent receptor [Phascolarctobacterium sp.]|nr:TonB-dependent receptor [Phascolarctobacterium sp.]